MRRIISLRFTDDFFIAIRYFYTARAQTPTFNRLSFVLLGAAMPGDLIKDSQRTPFNIGSRLDLEDFTLQEALPLAKGLNLPDSKASQVLEWVLYWTGGHPYLTQRLCQVLVEESEKVQRLTERSFNWSWNSVKQVVRRTFLEGGDRSNRNLQFVSQRLLTPSTKTVTKEDLLHTYRDVWKGKRIKDDEQSLVKSHLKLSGIVKQASDRTLALRNEIYRCVFDQRWIKANLLEGWWERNREVLRVAVPVTAVSVVSAITMGILSVVALHQRSLAQRQAILAEANSSKAFLLVGQQIEALIAASNSAQIVKQQNLSQFSEAALPALASLQQAVYPSRDFVLQKPFGFREHNSLEGHQGRISSVSFSPDGEMLVSADEYGAVKLWNREGQELSSLEGHQGRIFSVSFSPDGKAIASAGEDGIVKLWDREGKELGSIEGHLGAINSVSFSPDGKMIASAGSDGTVKLWNREGQELSSLEGHQSGVYSVSFSPDGKIIASASSDGTVKLWNRNLDSLLAQGCDWLSDYLRHNPKGQKAAAEGTCEGYL